MDEQRETILQNAERAGELFGREQKLRAIWDEVMKDPSVPPHDVVFSFARRAFDAGISSTLKI